tara:strand:+ start:642 stop:785 length:144 start_codon:yes stop_codon:yes gene_type:complete
MRVRLSAKADNDIEGILEYTLTRFGPEQANSYYLSLKECYAHPRFEM